MTTEKTYEFKHSAVRAARNAGLKDGEFDVEQVWQKGGKSHWRFVAKAAPTVSTEPVETPPVAESGPTATEPPADEDVPARQLVVEDYADQPKAEPTPPVATTTPTDEAKPKVERVKASTVANPVKFVWTLAEEMKAADPNVTRKAIVDACIAKGVAFYTAKTQVQRYLKSKKTTAPTS